MVITPPNFLKVLRFILSIVFLIGIGWICAGLVWRVATPTAQLQKHTTVSSVPLGQQATDEPESPSIIRPLFGVKPVVKQPPPPPPPPPPVEKPVIVQSRSQYTLRGIYIISDEVSFALIESEKKTSSYKKGDTLPGGEVLETIEADRVVLLKNDTREGLVLERPLIASDTPNTTLSSSTSKLYQTQNRHTSSQQRQNNSQQNSSRQNSSRQNSSQQNRQQYNASNIQPNVERLAPISRNLANDLQFIQESRKSVRFSRVRTKTGEIGQQIRWLKAGRFSETFGLQRGDVIVSVNSIPLAQKNALTTLARILSTQNEILLNIHRKNQPLTLIIPLQS